MSRLEDIVWLVTREGYSMEVDEDEGCVYVVDELTGRVVAKLWMEIEWVDEEVVEA